MKKILVLWSATLALVLFPTLLRGGNVKDRTYVEASELNIIGKLMDTPNPYHRVDTCVFKGFTPSENRQVRCSSGLAVLFKTNSSSVTVKCTYGYFNEATNTMGIALRGFDLYIRKGEEWIFAGSKCPADPEKPGEIKLVENMDGKMKECMLYLPIYSELYSLQIGVDQGSVLESLESPFRHRVGIFGSSYTQGISVSRSGMTYPQQFVRSTGIQLLSLGCSGNCKLQPYFADVLNAAEVDAFIFDAFSNPSAQLIKERLFPFIEKIQQAHPDIPLIFMQTIRRERRNFDQKVEKSEQDKMDMAEKLMKEAVKKYDHVYFIGTSTGKEARETSVDGIHPSDMGYMAWARSIEKPVLKILKKYGIR